jgi:two-component system, LuxR family, response regulator FixJ
MEKHPLVYIIDHESSVLQKLSRAIEPHYRTITYSHAKTFLQEYQDQPGCLICNICLPQISGLKLQEQLNQSKCFIPIIFITSNNDANTAVQALKKRAFDFLLEPLDLDSLLHTVHKALEIDQQRRYWSSKMQTLEERLRNLTPREREVMQLMAQGKTTKEIARILDVSPPTIEVHRGKVKKKLLIKNLAELIQQLQLFNHYKSHLNLWIPSLPQD